MAHVLSKLSGVKFEHIKQMLQDHAPVHNEQGMYLQHLWRNADNPAEVLFLFRVDDPKHAMQFMRRIHAEARKADPNAKIPETTFLDDSP